MQDAKRIARAAPEKPAPKPVSRNPADPDRLPSDMRERIEASARDVFGHPTLRPSQMETMAAILRGEDSFTILSTGQGKSLCYQLPAHLLKPDLTIVVSPLIALMNDQIGKLKAIGLDAACIHSDMLKRERMAFLDLIKSGAISMLYISPEQLGLRALYEAVSGRRVALLAVDEAHCVSTWGHDFRPSFLFIRNAREKLGNPTIALFTATAPPHIRKDILSILGVDRCHENFGTSVRENLHLEVAHFGNAENKLSRLIDILSKKPGPTIVYCTTIRTLEAVSGGLDAAGIKNERYFGQMDPFEKERGMDAFIGGASDVMVCTNAFGMGIDKPDIRMIIHFEIPCSLEEYYQQVGRAGRDGKPASGMLFFEKDDIRHPVHFIEMRNPRARFIQKVYTQLHSFYAFASERQGKSVSASQLLTKLSIDFKDDDHMMALARAAYGMLIEQGLIRLSGENAEMDREPASFDISEKMLRDKHSREYLRLGVLIEYANLSCGHGQYLGDYLERSTEALLRRYDSLEITIEKELLSALSSTIGTKRQIALVLTGRGKLSEAMLSNPSCGKLSIISLSDIEFRIDQMLEDGYLQRGILGKDIVYVMTPKGKLKASEFGVDPSCEAKPVSGSWPKPGRKRR
ncbi:MAG: RecQ family ATP-dependent DNA helicase [Candidatus Micrarchaeota archaeon]